MQSPRYVGHDRNPAVPRFVDETTRMAVHARDPFTVGRIVASNVIVEPPHVEREARRYRLDELVNALAAQRRDAQRVGSGSCSRRRSSVVSASHLL